MTSIDDKSSIVDRAGRVLNGQVDRVFRLRSDQNAAAFDALFSAWLVMGTRTLRNFPLDGITVRGSDRVTTRPKLLNLQMCAEPLFEIARAPIQSEIL